MSGPIKNRWRFTHDQHTQGARAHGWEKRRVRRSGAGNHRDHRDAGENTGWRAGEWFGPAGPVFPERASAWRPTDPRCSSPAAETVRGCASVAYNPSRSGWPPPPRCWLGQLPGIPSGRWTARLRAGRFARWANLMSRTFSLAPHPFLALCFGTSPHARVRRF